MVALPFGLGLGVPAFLVTLLVIIASVYVRYTYGYWRRRKIPYLEPRFPYGNNDGLMPKGISVGAITERFYNHFKSQGHALGGVYIGIKPSLLVVDPGLIKDILLKDFQHFTDRGIYMNKNETLAVNIFAQKGIDWKNSRVKFTSCFTSAKMKSMFDTMLECTEDFKGALGRLEEQNADLDVNEVTACFTTDNIGSCAFGVDCNSFSLPHAEFRAMGRKLFTEFRLVDRLKLFLSVYAPDLALRLDIRNIQKDVADFFMRTAEDMVSYREKSKFRRNDLMQLLVDLRHSDMQLTVDNIAAQVFVFFNAGFETSSTTTSMALFELSRNESIQDKARQEIADVVSRHDGRITYDGLAEMKYLGQIIDETLRLWPPVSTLTRVCTKEYRFANSDVVVEKGTSILIPVLGLQRDSEYWPDPLRFDPDRFSEANKDAKRPFTYLPFGDGPRNCIGLRFGMQQVKIGLVTVLSKYKVSVSPKTVLPVERDLETFVFMPKSPIYLRLHKI